MQRRPPSSSFLKYLQTGLTFFWGETLLDREMGEAEGRDDREDSSVEVDSRLSMVEENSKMKTETENVVRVGGGRMRGRNKEQERERETRVKKTRQEVRPPRGSFMYCWDGATWSRDRSEEKQNKTKQKQKQKQKQKTKITENN